jgi:hypothetical protein
LQLFKTESLASPYRFVSVVHTLGSRITPAEDERRYSCLNDWNSNTVKGKRTIVWVKQFYDSFWPDTYRHLKLLVKESSPDLIFADYQVEAARDVALETRTPLTVMWCQMPWMLMPQKYIPAQPGLQQRCLTSEKALLYDRLFDETYLLRSAPYLLK